MLKQVDQVCTVNTMIRLNKYIKFVLRTVNTINNGYELRQVGATKNKRGDPRVLVDYIT